jgi:DNA-binding transcriptional LysR family regulator
MAMNLHHLRLFAAVVDHGGFTKAAAKLGLSQPAISKSLSELERTLNVRLIDRSGRAARLTHAGRALHARARELFGVERLAEQELREIRGLKRGRLRIASTPTIASYLLPPVLGRLHRRRPAVRMISLTRDANSVARLLLESRVDVALSEDPVGQELIEQTAWRDDELHLIAPIDHELLRRDHVTPADLLDWQFLVDKSGSGGNAIVDRELSAHGVKRRRTLRLDGTEAIKQAVASGLGLAFVSRAALADQLALQRIAILPVDGLVLRRTLNRLKLRGRAAGISPASRELELLLDEASDGAVSSDATGASDLPSDF